jgi:hypothetical protein
MGNCGCKGESHELDDYLKSIYHNLILMFIYRAS